MLFSASAINECLNQHNVDSTTVENIKRYFTNLSTFGGLSKMIDKETENYTIRWNNNEFEDFSDLLDTIRDETHFYKNIDVVELMTSNPRTFFDMCSRKIYTNGESLIDCIRQELIDYVVEEISERLKEFDV